MLEFTFVYGENGYELSRDLRKSVFGKELTDDMEETSYHLVGYDKINQVASARFTVLTEDVCRIDFVAVAEEYKRKFVGDLIIKAIEDKAKSLGVKEAIADVPEEVMPFFEFEGYTDSGSQKEVFGKVCKIMRKDLTIVHKCRGCV